MNTNKKYNLKFLVNRAMNLMLSWPKTVLTGIVLVTIFFSYNVTKLRLDPSVEYIMPKDDPVYKLGQRAKAAFVDSKTFLLSAFQATDGYELFSQDVFSQIEQVVEELDEYHNFDVEKEDTRLQTLLTLSQVQIKSDTDTKEENTSPVKNSSVQATEDELDAQFFGEDDSSAAKNSSENYTEKKPNEEKEASQTNGNSTNHVDDIEAQLDDVFFNSENAEEDKEENVEENNSAEKTNKKQNIKSQESLEKIFAQGKSEQDIWDDSTPLPEGSELEATRKRNNYDYSNYQAVSLNELHASLDATAGQQLQTILRAKKMQKLDWETPLKRKQFRKILEAWEDIYLFKSMMVVKTFNNPITGMDITGNKDSLIPIRFIDRDENGKLLLPKTKQEFTEYKRRISLNPLNKATLYSVDKEGNIDALAMTITLRYMKNYEKLLSYIWPLLEKYDAPPLKVYSIGNLVIQEFIGKYMNGDLVGFVPLVLLVVLLAFFFNFRSLRGVILPTLAVVLGMIWTMGTMGFLGLKISMLVSILPALLVAIGSSYSIHVFNQYMKDLKTINIATDQGKRKESLRKSVLHIFPTVFLAALTTIISFLTLVTNQVVSLREFGLFAAVGSFYASVIAFVMIPTILMVMKKLPHEKYYHSNEELKEHLMQKLVNVIGNFSISHSTGVVIVSTLLVLIGIAGVFRVKVETSPMANFKKSSYIRQADTYLGKHFDGTFVVNLVIDSGSNGGVIDPQFLNFLQELTAWADQPEQKEKYLILHLNSFADFIKRVNMAMHANDPKYFSIPQNKNVIIDFMQLFGGDDLDANGRSDQIEQFVDKDFRRVNVIIRTGTYKGRMVTTASNNMIQKKVDEFLNTLDNPSGYKWFFVGEAPSFSILADYVTIGQVQNILASLVIISLLLFYLFKSVSAGLVGIIPVTVGISFVYGSMGFLNIPLDIPKVILASVAIGIGVDNTIHFMKTLTHYLKPGVSLDQALRAAHQEAGLAVVYTSLALIFGFSVLMLSNFVPVFYLGLLVAGVMLSTTFGALVVLPAVIKFVNLQVKETITFANFEEDENNN